LSADVSGEEQEAGGGRAQSEDQGGRGITPTVVSGTTLSSYRLAAAATAEYTQAYGGGTIGGALTSITTTVNLVDAIYEREVAIRLTLIAGETSIIFTDTTTDGYTSDNVNALIGENQTKLNSVIGPANYDIGHVFDGRLLGGGAFHGRASRPLVLFVMTQSRREALISFALYSRPVCCLLQRRPRDGSSIRGHPYFQCEHRELLNPAHCNRRLTSRSTAQQSWRTGSPVLRKT